MSLLSTGRQITRTIKNAGRLKTIVSVFARHGFTNVAERIKLGRFLLERISQADNIEKLSVPERIRLTFEELGPTFVKLGQLLASRPDLVPQEWVDELSKLHDNVQTLPVEVIEQVIAQELGDLKNEFTYFDPQPLGAASIAQVHRARLKDGSDVVIKVQRPGIMQTINEDLNVLYFLAELLETYIPETKTYNPVAVVDEYFKTLELETNFIIEANNIRRFTENFSQTPEAEGPEGLVKSRVKIPHVYFELTTEKVLTMEAMKGLPLSHDKALLQPDINPDEIIKIGLRAYLKMVFKDGLFHGDLHAGNFFVQPHDQIALIDFGVVGRLNSRTQTAIASMLVALAQEDYERLANEYIDLTPFSETVDVDIFSRDLRNLIAPYYGLTLKNVNLGKILLSSSSVAAKHQLKLPAELMIFFKSLVGIEGLGKKIHPDFDFLKYATEFATEMMKHQYEPAKMMADMNLLVRESKTFLSALPRQLNFFLRKINSPEHAVKLHVEELRDLRKSVESSFNLLFLGFIISTLLICSVVIYVFGQNLNLDQIPTASAITLVIAMMLGLVAVVNYIRK